MSGPYTVRIVQADGVARTLRRIPSTNVLTSGPGNTYLTIKSARRAARKYLGNGKHLGTHYVDICDDNDPERHIDL